MTRSACWRKATPFKKAPLMRGFCVRLGQWGLARAGEKSTYVGVALLAIALGREVPPAILAAVEWWAPFLATGLIAASTSDRSLGR